MASEEMLQQMQMNSRLSIRTGASVAESRIQFACSLKRSVHMGSARMHCIRHAQKRMWLHQLHPKAQALDQELCMAYMHILAKILQPAATSR